MGAEELVDVLQNVCLRARLCVRVYVRACVRVSACVRVHILRAYVCARIRLS